MWKSVRDECRDLADVTTFDDDFTEKSIEITRDFPNSNFSDSRNDPITFFLSHGDVFDSICCVVFSRTQTRNV